MEKLNSKQVNELMEIRRKSGNVADMINGCKNRMCICDTEEELDQLYLAITLHANQLYRLARRRLYVKEYPDFDKLPKIEL